MQRYRMVLGMGVVAFAALLIGQAAPSCSVTPEMIIPQGDGSGLDADMVDGVHATQILGPARTIVSAYFEVNCDYGSCPPDMSIMDVPSNKQFILTDVIVNFEGEPRIILRGNDRKMLPITLKPFFAELEGAAERDPATRAIQFKSGIPFAPGTNINIYDWTSGQLNIRMTIAGYLIDAAS